MQAKSEWISVGALGDAFKPDNHCLEAVNDLVGRGFVLNFENGWSIRHEFSRPGELTWSPLPADAPAAVNQETCSVTCPRPDIYFVDFLKSQERATSVSLILNLREQTFIAVIAQLPDATEALMPLLKRAEHGKPLTGVNASFLRGTIDVPFQASQNLPQPTGDLLGKRIEYVYSPQERYEHLYLNERCYTWRCIEGSEKGLADTDLCHYYKIADNLYLFVWREKIIPTLGVILINLEAMKTTGKIMGYEGNDFGAVRNFPVGAHARVLSVIDAE